MKALRVAVMTVVGFLAMNSTSLAQERSFLCKFTSGPRAGEIQDYTGHPSGPLPVGSSCQDGMGSYGVIVSARGGGDRGGGGADGQGGSCRRPATEDDCDKCNSDAAYERCLEKVG